MRMHEPGDCPIYGHSDCNGIGHFVENPFAAEVYGDLTPRWQCDAELYESAMDI